MLARAFPGLFVSLLAGLWAVDGRAKHFVPFIKLKGAINVSQ